MVHNSASSASSAAASSSNQHATPPLEDQGQRGVKRARSVEFSPVHNNPNMRRLSAGHGVVVGSSAQASSRAEAAPSLSAFGVGCVAAEVLEREGIDNGDGKGTLKYSLLKITRKLEFIQGGPLITEYYSADSSRRSSPGSAEEEIGNPVHNWVSNGVAAFGNEYALDDGELPVPKWRADSRHLFLGLERSQMGKAGLRV